MHTFTSTRWISNCMPDEGGTARLRYVALILLWYLSAIKALDYNLRSMVRVNMCIFLRYIQCPDGDHCSTHYRRAFNPGTCVMGIWTKKGVPIFVCPILNAQAIRGLLSIIMMAPYNFRSHFLMCQSAYLVYLIARSRSFKKKLA